MIEMPCQEAAHGVVIFHNKDKRRGGRNHRLVAVGFHNRLRRYTLQGQRYCKCRTFAGHTFYAHIATQQPGELFYHSQADARSLSYRSRVYLVEPVKDVRLLFFIDAYTCVGHGNDQDITIGRNACLFKHYDNGVAGVGELEGVSQQIIHDMLQLFFVKPVIAGRQCIAEHQVLRCRSATG